tara:strand:- start:28512 stop:28613 length:102 start_codon:yes stop_codon:yes gene_type:complete
MGLSNKPFQVTKAKPTDVGFLLIVDAHHATLIL